MSDAIERVRGALLVGDEGSYVVFDEQLVTISPEDLAAFAIAIDEEARRRGLDVTVDRDLRSLTTTFAWRPGFGTPGGS